MDATHVTTTGKDSGPDVTTIVSTGDASQEDSHVATQPDASHGSEDAGHDAGTTPTVDAAAVMPTHMLVTYGAASTSETVSVNLTTKAIEGRIPFAGFGVTDGHNTSSPYLLEQNASVVARLDSTKPWEIDSTWNVLLTYGADGGSLYADPVQVVNVSSTKAYVLRYDRNAVAIIDPANVGDGGAPTASIDLSGYLEPGDTDGVLEMSAAAYVASSNRVYIALANYSEALYAQYGSNVICGTAITTIVAIDAQNDTVVNLGGTGPKGAIELLYANPSSVVYDATGGRLLVVGSGCYPQPSAGGTVGTPQQRGVEAVDLATGKSASLLEITATAFPSGFVDVPTGFVYIDSTHAVLGFDGTGQAVYSWNPTTTTLGSVIPNAPDVFTYDGNGHLVGTRQDTTDAGVTSSDLVSVAVSNGASTTLAKNVTSLSGTTYVASVDVWPHP